MVAENEVLDRLYGMISKELAGKVSKGEFGNPDVLLKNENEPFTSEEMALLSETEWNEIKAKGSAFKVWLKDKVYRVFNPIVIAPEQEPRRTIILGSEGKTTVVNLRGRMAEAVDIIPLERGDVVSMKGLLIITERAEFVSGPSATLEKVSQSKLPVMTDFSLITGELKNTDVVGDLVEISETKKVKSMFGPREVEVCEGTLGLVGGIARISFWGSSANATKGIAAGSRIKIEFATVRKVGDALFVSAADSSRICKYAKSKT